MTVNDAINSKGLRVSADKCNAPKYVGILFSVTKIADTWYARIDCEDGEMRNFRVIYLRKI